MSQLKRDSNEFLLLAISGFTVLAVLPFAFLRVIEKNWFIATLDWLIVLAMAGVYIHIYRTHQTQVAKYVIATAFIIGMNLTVFFNGTNQLFWAYPATLALFFMLPYNKAISFSCVGLMIMWLLIGDIIGKSALVTFAITIFSTNVFAYVFARRQSENLEKLYKLSQKDPLTGAGNRRALDTKLSELLYLNQRTRIPASMLMIDIDKFKNINDVHGHSIGDLALKTICKLISYRIRFSDSLFRFGGEEFIVLTESTPLKDATKLAEELRQVVASSDVIEDAEITLSIGVAEVELGESAESWINRADIALYQAKNSGRNKVCQAPLFSETIAASASA